MERPTTGTPSLTHLNAAQKHDGLERSERSRSESLNVWLFTHTCSPEARSHQSHQVNNIGIRQALETKASQNCKLSSKSRSTPPSAHHKPQAKHLSRYVAEFTCRLNPNSPRQSRCFETLCAESRLRESSLLTREVSRRGRSYVRSDG